MIRLFSPFHFTIKVRKFWWAGPPFGGTPMEKEIQWQSWIEDARRGDNSAFEFINERFQPLILKNMTRFGWYKDRDELLQEARLTLYLAILEYSPDKGVMFPGYVASRIHYRLWNTVRRSIRIWNHEASERSGDEDGDIETHADPILQLPCPYAACAFEEVEQEEMFSSLSDREKLATHYLFIERVKPSELADMCGVSVETVKTWRKRAIQKLKRELSKT
jgi:RNA polymerase sigma factor (sigma-70 family)